MQSVRQTQGARPGRASTRHCRHCAEDVEVAPPGPWRCALPLLSALAPVTVVGVGLVGPLVLLALVPTALLIVAAAPMAAESRGSPRCARCGRETFESARAAARAIERVGRRISAPP